MRIFYIAELDPVKEKGVFYKVTGQCNAWIAKGHDVRLVIILPRLYPDLNLPDYIEMCQSQLISGVPHNFLINYLGKVAISRTILSKIKRHNSQLIYFRQAIWFPGLNSILRSAVSVMEVNTDDVSELKFASLLKRKYYFLVKNRILKNLNGIISVTGEIANKYQQFGKKIRVVANGYDFSLVEGKKMAKSDEVNLIFVCSNLPWHGLDKVLYMANVFPQFTFHLVGPDLKLSESDNSMNNVKYHGFLTKDQLNELYPFMHVGIGSLSLHLYNLNEACPLKTREYLAHGLPVILGYKDTDIGESDDFALYLGNGPENVLNNLKEIEAFVWKWKDGHIPCEVIRKRIDYAVKEDQRLAFFDELLEDGRN